MRVQFLRRKAGSRDGCIGGGAAHILGRLQGNRPARGQTDFAVRLHGKRADRAARPEQGQIACRDIVNPRAVNCADRCIAEHFHADAADRGVSRLITRRIQLVDLSHTADAHIDVAVGAGICRRDTLSRAELARTADHDHIVAGKHGDMRCRGSVHILRTGCAAEVMLHAADHPERLADVTADIVVHRNALADGDGMVLTDDSKVTFSKVVSSARPKRAYFAVL